MPDRPTLLWIGADTAPQTVRQAAGDRWDVKPLDHSQPMAKQLRDAGVAVICPNDNGHDALHLGAILQELKGSAAVAVFMLNESESMGEKMLSGRRGQFLSVPATVSPEVLEAQIAAVWALQPAIADLHRDIFNLRSVNGIARGAGETLDEEMRLASRLQRDFLPRRLPEVGDARFSVLYRPISFVSGDIYDVTRLDETHVGFYIADAVGHGLPAALLTMFIKKALQTKRIVGNTYEIIPPDVSLAELNDDICAQDLSSCNFCTAIYGVLDVSTLTLTYARAGHPAPVLVRRDGAFEPLEADGCLLGVFDDAEFESREVSLDPGDRIVLYTDGACDSLAGETSSNFTDIFGAVLTLPRTDMMVEITSRIEKACSEGMQVDDITVMALDIEP
ncbi:MAG: PP2C family protein-serine/threonine phosphatase [Phycisphaerae bacterium]|nr:PP2C family protein-serine/threonine phosphatase [Phycisphaerae bacterium]